MSTPERQIFWMLLQESTSDSDWEGPPFHRASTIRSTPIDPSWTCVPTAPRTTPTPGRRGPSPGRYTTGGPRCRTTMLAGTTAWRTTAGDCSLGRWCTSSVSDAALLGDIIPLETNGRKVEFHHSKLQRRQDVDRRKKRRKIEWLKQMYDCGCLHARTEHSETAMLVERSAQGMMDAVEQLGPNHIVEWEVDELLEWTNALNFDEYINDWRVVGTSNSSESWKDKRPSNLEPCVEFSGLGQEDSQVDTYSSILHPLVSSLIKSEHSKANL
ncbi:protein MFI isoform X2 [Salmo trutta]|uniref:protein MFI isoform X2 n=1 Tax=Salmo trutta TaxID=8032 RepID=UPI0011329C59|nr:uncharacterized protein C11orf65 homolog isoform X2 [Salmo trutta]